MNEIDKFITYINSIYTDFCNDKIKLGYDNVDIMDLFYNYLKNDEEDFSEFEENYFNYEEYQNMNIKELFKKYAFSLFYMLYFYDTNGNVEDDEICKAMRNYNIDDDIFDKLFDDAGISMEAIDGMDVYLNMKPVEQKVLALNLEKDEYFEDVCRNNKILAMLYYHYSKIDVSEEEMIIYNVSQLVDNFHLEQDIDDENYYNYTKVKKQLIIQSLAKDTKLKRSTPYIKHLFSVMLENIYCDIHFAKVNETRNISIEDNKLYELINNNNISFDELFDMFKNDEIFSNYIIKTFYNINLYKESFELAAEKLVVKDDKLNQKIKKYYVE